jgi:hypothetical protein
VSLTGYLDAVWSSLSSLTHDDKRALLTAWAERAAREHIAEHMRAAALVGTDFAARHYPGHIAKLRALPALSSSTSSLYKSDLESARFALRTNASLLHVEKNPGLPLPALPVEVAFHYAVDLAALVESSTPLTDADVARAAVRLTVVAERCGSASDRVSEERRQCDEISARA